MTYLGRLKFEVLSLKKNSAKEGKKNKQHVNATPTVWLPRKRKKITKIKHKLRKKLIVLKPAQHERR